MDNIKKYKRQKSEFELTRDVIIRDIKKDVLNIKDIKGLKRTGMGFTINSSSLGESWLPRYYDNKAASTCLVEMIAKCDTIEKILKILQDVISTKRLANLHINQEFVDSVAEIEKKYHL